jgi:hypothetical protein
MAAETAAVAGVHFFIIVACRTGPTPDKKIKKLLRDKRIGLMLCRTVEFEADLRAVATLARAWAARKHQSTSHGLATVASINPCDDGFSPACGVSFVLACGDPYPSS